jgi:endonuclease/exonuclease/phosphatase family metal-dependent hydrolase
MTPHRLVLALLAALAAAASVSATGGDTRGRSKPATVRVLTYNIHHGEGLDGRVDLPRLAAVIGATSPDLVALQEVDRGTRRAGGVDQLAELGRLTAMEPVFGRAMAYQDGEYGVGVLSRLRVRRALNRALPGSPGREPRTALTVDVAAGEASPRVLFTTTHLDNGRDAMDKVAQASYLAGAVSRDGEAASILAGDMNARADTPAMQILARHWSDTLADPPPAPDGRPRRRIDYVMVRPAASWRVLEARVVAAPLASDHQPVLVVLEWLGRGAAAAR